MKLQSRDTNLKVEKVLISLLQNATVVEKFNQVQSLSEMTMQMSRRAIARANPDLDDDKINLLFIEYHYGKDLADRLERYLEDRNDTQI